MAYQQLKIALKEEIDTTMIKRIADQAFIPCSLENRDYVEYLKWLEAGNTPLPPEGTE